MSDERIRYNMDWCEFDPALRASLLEEANIWKYDFVNEANNAHFFLYETGLSSSQKMIVEFVQSPTRPVNFSVFDLKTGKKVLDVHIAFWKYYFSR